MFRYEWVEILASDAELLPVCQRLGADGWDLRFRDPVSHPPLPDVVQADWRLLFRRVQSNRDQLRERFAVAAKEQQG